jgi:hypothetical protein
MFRHAGDGKVLSLSVTGKAEEKTTQVKISAGWVNGEAVSDWRVPFAVRIKAVNPARPHPISLHVTAATVLETGIFARI